MLLTHLRILLVASVQQPMDSLRHTSQILLQASFIVVAGGNLPRILDYISSLRPTFEACCALES
jgi:hypothetical protein